MTPLVLERPDAVLHGEAAGAGPTVLLLHAGGERRQVWMPVVRTLVEAGFRCVAFDQRGHGESDGAAATLAPFAADVRAMIDAQPAGSIVVGASLGGLAAIAALADPAVQAKVSGLVLVDVVPDPEPNGVRRFLAATGMLDGRVDVVDAILAQADRLRQITAALDVPILLTYGISSPLAGEIDRFVERTPKATATGIPGAGHLVARDQPVPLAHAIASTVGAWPARALMRDLGAADVDHPGGKLLDHLERVHELVVSWDARSAVRRAALCHATYGTDGFPRPLLPLHQRARLRSTIGDDAERLVHLYGACDRSRTYPHLRTVPLALADRFTGEVVLLAGADLTDFALLTIANELDVARTALLTPEGRHDIRALGASLAHCAPAIAAQALADPSLA